MYDITTIRQDFPILSRTIRGVPLVYLDNAATTQKPRMVIEALVDVYNTYNSNVHRGIHTLSMEATDAYETARRKIADFINAPNPENIIFVRGTTEAINLVAQSWGMSNINRGDRIVATEMEHHSNIVPWQHVASVREAELRFAALDRNYCLDMDDFQELLSERTKLVTATHVSNVLGTILPVHEIVERAHEVGAFVMIDGAQSVPHMPVDVQEMDCDFFAFSGHKMAGPTGIGVLYVKTQILEQMEPFLRGGEMVLEVTFEDAKWNDLPMKFEAGTPNYADAIALGAAVDYLNQIGMGDIRRHEMDLTAYALQRFGEIEEATTYGPNEVEIRGGVVSFYLGDVHPHDIGQVLDQAGVAIRAGHHCAMPLVRTRLMVPATARASFYLYNTKEEIDVLIDGLKQAVRFFGHAGN